MGIEEFKKLKDSVSDVESKTVPGANVLTPRESMLDARDVEAQHPDKHLRWVNIRDRQKAESRKLEGYTRLAPSEGGRALGDELALMSISKERAEEKIERIKADNEARLSSHRSEMESMAESVARQMRDRHGISVDPSRILINE